MRDKVTKLHLGCFDQVLEGWINTDVTPHIFVSRIPGLSLTLFKFGLLSQERYEQHKHGVFRSVRYMNATKKFPYPNGIFDCVFSEHLLEHLYPPQAIFCIRETYRVLREGGIVRIAVPDLDKIIASYDFHNPEDFLESIFEANQKYEKNKHHWHYNEISLTKLLKETGFSKIYRCKFQDGNCADVALIDNINKRFINCCPTSRHKTTYTKIKC